MQASDAIPRCYHCDHPIDAGTVNYVEIDGASRPMCCAGGKAVAEAIIADEQADYCILRNANIDRDQSIFQNSTPVLA